MFSKLFLSPSMCRPSGYLNLFSEFTLTAILQTIKHMIRRYSLGQFHWQCFFEILTVYKHKRQIDKQTSVMHTN